MIKNAQEIHDEADIISVVRSRVPDLKKQGVNYQVCCPFHNEKSPSFVVSPTKGIYKCFGCGKGGKAVDFIMEYDGVSYPEALKEVANIMSITLDIENGVKWEEIAKENKARESIKEGYYLTNEAYQKYYSELFFKSFADRNEIDIDGRTYSQQILRDFGVWFASESAGYRYKDASSLLSLGLLKPSKISGQQFWEPFKKRLVFPIRNKKGRIAGFSGRKMSDEKDKKKVPKYINSSESVIYNKSELLYGFYESESSIRKRGFVYIVEGNTDVLTMHDHGIKNVVASCGTSITEKHVDILALKADVAILLLDGDDAGVKAAKRAIPLFLEKQMECKVCILPHGEDPDSYLRKIEKDSREERAEVFRDYADGNTTDAILWHVAMEYGEGASNHVQLQALEIAANYISKLDSDLLRDQYAREIQKIIGYGLNGIKAEINKVRNRELEGQVTLTPDQLQDALKYGICEDHNKYYDVVNGKLSTELTNFIIIPLLLVKGQDQALRVIEVKNENGHSFIKSMNSDALVEMNTFRKELARNGHFIFKPYAKAEHFIRITDKVYAETKNCWPIHTMGYHKEGFWAWGNGISVDGQFYPVDDYGIVEYEDNKYFLPSFSKINVDLKSDDPEGEDDFASDIIYVERPNKTVTVSTWAQQFYTVHGANGMVAIAYYLAALFRDIVFKEMDKTFPHLNLFGPPGSGKSYMAWSLSFMFGKARGPFNLDQGTDVGFFRRAAQIRNMIVWYDEYASDISIRRSKALKGFYDGSGREKGRHSNDNKTSITKVNSAVLISGQELPNSDPALLERCITLFFQPQKPTPKMVAEGDKLKEMEKHGDLSQITSHLQQYRELIKEEFRLSFQEVRSMLQQMADGFEIKGRLLNNFSAIATIFYILSKQETFPFRFTDLMDFMLERMKEQVNTVKGSDEISGWWSMIEYLAGERLLKEEEDYMVKDLDKLTIQKDTIGAGAKDHIVIEEDEESKSKRTVKIGYDQLTRVLFVKLNKAHKLYLEYSRKQGSDRTLDSSSLQHYLRISDSFIGQTTQRFSGRNQRCWAFLVDKTNADLHPTISPTDNMGFPITKEDPF